MFFRFASSRVRVSTLFRVALLLLDFFFVVFFAEAADKHENAILLLDEPGLSLHGLKQRDFRITVSRLAKANQTVYTTHSPFLVGPDELDLVQS